MNNDVTMPPYPGIATASRGLYRCLRELHGWLGDALSVLPTVNFDAALSSQLLQPDWEGDETIWDAVGIVDKYLILSGLRQIREEWDAILRDYEQAWDAPKALRRRAGVCIAAARLISGAFVTPEHREAQYTQQVEQFMTKVRRDERKFAKLMDTVRDDDDDDDPEASYDPNNPDDELRG